jgi:PAS domain S-box-containing protein
MPLPDTCACPASSLSCEHSYGSSTAFTLDTDSPRPSHLIPEILNQSADDVFPQNPMGDSFDSSPDGESYTTTNASGGNRFLRDRIALSPDGHRSQTTSPFRISMPSFTQGQLAFSAMQYLPVPILVLSSLKTVVLANDAMGRLLGLTPETDPTKDQVSVADQIRGQTLSQVGIDLLQDGQPVWMVWESFLDSLVNDINQRQSRGPSMCEETPSGADAPSTLLTDGYLPQTNKDLEDHFSFPMHEPVVEVIISKKDIEKAALDPRFRNRQPEYQVFAKMIITVWEVEDHQTYFTLTFTSTQPHPSSLVNAKRQVARPNMLEAADRKIIALSNPTSASSRESSSHSPSFRPGAVSLSASPFPPMGPPSAATHNSAPSMLQKITMMKDALLDTIKMPILSMWKDGTVSYPNKAARQLFQQDEAHLDHSVDGFGMLHNWSVYTEDFSRQLSTEEYPIAQLIRTEQSFTDRRIGMHGPDGQRIVFDVIGEALRDEQTGEFLAGVIACRDITTMTQEILDIKAKDDERFRLICDTMPQLVWTARPDGSHDFFNTRWYHYTGRTAAESLGDKWRSPFHPEDIPEASRRWERSLRTGEPYAVEYRCKSKDGEWKWFLGRALPQRNKTTGQIEKWFGESLIASNQDSSATTAGLAMLITNIGTCTDVNEAMETKLTAERTRQQLLSVIAHAHVTIFTVDTHRKVTMLEGALEWDSTQGNMTNADEPSRWYIGKDMYEVFNRLNRKLPVGAEPVFLRPIEDMLSGKMGETVTEHGIG